MPDHKSEISETMSLDITGRRNASRKKIILLVMYYIIHLYLNSHNRVLLYLTMKLCFGGKKMSLVVASFLFPEKKD